MSKVITAADEHDFAAAHESPSKNGRPKAASLQSSSVFDEGFRLLALNVQRLLGDGHRRSIVVLSARPREGRSTTAACLAKALSRLAPPVLLIDADPDGSGIARVMSAWHESAEEAWGGRPRLQVVNPWFAAGTPETFLDRVHDAVEEGLDAGATVVVDAPACLTSSAAFYLATGASGVLYVTRPSTSKDGSVHADVRAQLDLLGARVLGVVVNEG